MPVPLRLSPAIAPYPARTESDASLLTSFQAAHDAGLSVLFKAALSTLNGTRVSSLAPADVAAFFASYKAEIVHLANGMLRHRFGYTPKSRNLRGPSYFAKAVMQKLLRDGKWVKRERASRHEDWSEFQTMTDLALMPAACYPVYPAVAARGPVDPSGVFVEENASKIVD